jgi:hypothetical protein
MMLLRTLTAWTGIMCLTKRELIYLATLESIYVTPRELDMTYDEAHGKLGGYLGSILGSLLNYWSMCLRHFDMMDMNGIGSCDPK